MGQKYLSMNPNIKPYRISSTRDLHLAGDSRHYQKQYTVERWINLGKTKHCQRWHEKVRKDVSTLV